MCTQSGVNPAEKKQNNNSQCIVEFRPDTDWRGEYGFDWLRVGDYPEYINANKSSHLSVYKLLVGKYNPPFSENISEFYNTNKYFNNLETEYPETYQDNLGTTIYVPYLSLYFDSVQIWPRRVPPCMLEKRIDGHLYRKKECVVSATIRLIIKAKNISVIKFKCDDCIKVDPPYIQNIKDGEDRTNTITITYKYYSGVEKKVIAKAVENGNSRKEFVAGQLNIMGYYPKILNVCLFPIKTNNKKVVKTGSFTILEQEEERLRKFLSQALVVPVFHNRVITERGKYEEVKTLLNKYRQDGVNGLSSTRSYLKSNNKKETKWLLSELNNLFPLHNDEYWIFLLDEDNEDGSKGEAWLNSIDEHNQFCNAAIVYRNPDLSVTCHELLHLLGLEHSFSNSSKHTFAKATTSNIMDYYSNDNHYSLWKWQWDMIREKCNNVPIPPKTNIT